MFFSGCRGQCEGDGGFGDPSLYGRALRALNMTSFSCSPGNNCEPHGEDEVAREVSVGSHYVTANRTLFGYRAGRYVEMEGREILLSCRMLPNLSSEGDLLVKIRTGRFILFYFPYPPPFWQALCEGERRNCIPQQVFTTRLVKSTCPSPHPIYAVGSRLAAVPVATRSFSLGRTTVQMLEYPSYATIMGVYGEPGGGRSIVVTLEVVLADPDKATVRDSKQPVWAKAHGAGERPLRVNEIGATDAKLWVLAELGCRFVWDPHRPYGIEHSRFIRVGSTITVPEGSFPGNDTGSPKHVPAY
nr:hypothetical protein B24B19.200 [imported] - Neurospora crassa [Neurospora crassa]